MAFESNSKSAQLCGCDEGANWICERHTKEAAFVDKMDQEAIKRIYMTQPHANLNAIDFSVLNQIGDAARFNAEDKGFITGASEQGPEIDRKLLLMVGEIVEAHEEIRSGHAPTEIYYKEAKPEGVPVELADAIIRIVQFAHSQGINIGDAVELKMRYNLTRPPKHGREF